MSWSPSSSPMAATLADIAARARARRRGAAGPRPVSASSGLPRSVRSPPAAVTAAGGLRTDRGSPEDALTGRGPAAPRRRALARAAMSANVAAMGELLGDHDILRLRAGNPGPLTLSGTNTWVVGRGPAWVVDPGPLLREHLDGLLAAVQERGGLGGVVLTHRHGDHAD